MGGLDALAAILLVVGGTPSPDDQAVVALRVAAACGAPATFECSATVVSSRALLTAAHCVPDPIDQLEIVFGADVSAPLQVMRIAAVARHPTLDLAIVTLPQATSTTPMPIVSTVPANLVGQSVRVVGFGADDQGNVGVRRAGTSVVSQLEPLQFVTMPAPALTCNGDSGGPVLLAGSIAGVTVSGDPSCHLTGTCVRADADTAWLSGRMAEAAAAPLGDPPPPKPDCGGGGSDGGCSVASGGVPSGSFLIVAALILRRRRGSDGQVTISYHSEVPRHRRARAATVEGPRLQRCAARLFAVDASAPRRCSL